MRKPKVSVDKNQAYFWTQKWQKAERDADADISAGRLRTFESVDDLLQDLE